MFENMIKLRKEWKKLDDDAQWEYHEAVTGDKRRYEREWEEYKTTGWFTD